MIYSCEYPHESCAEFKVPYSRACWSCKLGHVHCNPQHCILHRHTAETCFHKPETDGIDIASLMERIELFFEVEPDEWRTLKKLILESDGIEDVHGGENYTTLKKEKA